MAENAVPDKALNGKTLSHAIRLKRKELLHGNTGMGRLLDPKQKKAADLYLAGKTKKEALALAGYKSYNIAVFKNELVQRYMNRRLNSLMRRHKVSQERIVEEYAKIAFFNKGDFMVQTDDGHVIMDISNMTPDETAAISEYVVEEYKEGRGGDKREIRKVRIKEYDKLRALDSLARIKGMFDDKLNVSGKVSLVERINKGRKRVAGTDEKD